MSNFSYDIGQCCCFTGHRPDKLKSDEETVKARLKEKILEAIDDGYKTFISGMAPGVDLWGAEIVIELRKDHPELNLVCAFPYKKDKFSDEERFAVENATHVEYVTERYKRSYRYENSCFMLRNQWMVDRSSRVIAVFNGTTGGTKHTIDYARSQDKIIRLIVC